MKITYFRSITICAFLLVLVTYFVGYHYSSYHDQQRHIIQELWEISLPDVSGHTTPLPPQDTKILVLTFWGTWCAYCLEEIPWFNKISEDLPLDTHIVAVAIDDQDAVRSFVDTYNIHLLDIRLSNTKTLSLLKKIVPTFSGLPMTLIINNKYEILHKNIGNYASYQDLALSMEQVGNNCKK